MQSVERCNKLVRALIALRLLLPHLRRLLLRWNLLALLRLLWLLACACLSTRLHCLCLHCLRLRLCDCVVHLLRHSPRADRHVPLRPRI